MHVWALRMRTHRVNTCGLRTVARQALQGRDILAITSKEHSRKIVAYAYSNNITYIYGWHYNKRDALLVAQPNNKSRRSAERCLANSFDNFANFVVR